MDDTALHGIGHTLGLPHEHQNPNAGIVWDVEHPAQDRAGHRAGLLLGPRLVRVRLCFQPGPG